MNKGLDDLDMTAMRKQLRCALQPEFIHWLKRLTLIFGIIMGNLLKQLWPSSSVVLNGLHW